MERNEKDKRKSLLIKYFLTVNRKIVVYKFQFGFLNSMANEVAFFYGFGIMNAWQQFGNYVIDE